VTAIVHEPGGGETIGDGGYMLRFLAESPGQPLAIVENTVPPRFAGPLRHRHEHMTDVFYVLDGEMALELDGVVRRLGPGGFALVPPGVVHTFSNPADVALRFLNIYHPPGNEAYLREVGERTAAGDAPSPVEMAAMAARYDSVPVDDSVEGGERSLR
jgi:mannose-6-phosphate isomerase-like protein (cupin superfamily)